MKQQQQQIFCSNFENTKTLTLPTCVSHWNKNCKKIRVCMYMCVGHFYSQIIIFLPVKANCDIVNIYVSNNVCRVSTIERSPNNEENVSFVIFFSRFFVAFRLFWFISFGMSVSSKGRRKEYSENCIHFEMLRYIIVILRFSFFIIRYDFKQKAKNCIKSSSSIDGMLWCMYFGFLGILTVFCNKTALCCVDCWGYEHAIGPKVLPFEFYLYFFSRSFVLFVVGMHSAHFTRYGFHHQTRNFSFVAALVCCSAWICTSILWKYQISWIFISE